MAGYLKRLLRGAAAYQFADIVAKVLALALLPVYTRHLSRADYGIAELLVTLVIFVSILVRLGIHESFVRYWFADEDPEARRALARRSVGFLLAATTAVALLGAIFAAPLSELILDRQDTGIMLAAVLGLWAFTNLELAYALLRVEEKWRTYATASLINVALTVASTVVLVVALDQGALGLLLGNYAASALVLVGVLWTQRATLRPAVDTPVIAFGTLFAFGGPTVPAEASLFALNLVDRWWLFHRQSAAAAGLYALAVKLAGVVVFSVRAFQYAWPPLAYSVRDDDEAARLYAVVATWYVAATGIVVAGLTLLGRWLVRLFAAPSFFAAHEALPWVSLGWALYGLVLVLVAVAGRARVTTRNFPAAFAGLAVNVLLLALLVPSLGPAGAGIALCGAYLVMLAVLHALTRRLFPVSFEWGRLAHAAGVCTGFAVAGEVLLPDVGAGGFIARSVVLLAIPAVLLLTGFLRPGERRALGALRDRVRARGGDRPGSTPPPPREGPRPETGAASR
jgi:O-antigen/teichoic acid export membrane protein